MKKIIAILLSFLVLLIVSCTPVSEDVAVDGDMEEVEGMDNVEENSAEEMVEESQEVAVEEEVEEVEGESGEEVEIEEEQVSDDSVHTVEITEDGFEPDELIISVGDTVEWVNLREGYRIDQAKVMGIRGNTITSDTLMTGESFSYTFTEKGEYLFADEIIVHQLFTLTVE